VSSRCHTYIPIYTVGCCFPRTQTPSVSFHRCRCVSVKCVERVLSVLEARVNVCRGESLRRLEFSFCVTAVGRWRGERFGRYRCLILRYSLLLSVWVDPSAEHTHHSWPFPISGSVPKISAKRSLLRLPVLPYSHRRFVTQRRHCTQIELCPLRVNPV